MRIETQLPLKTRVVCHPATRRIYRFFFSLPRWITFPLILLPAICIIFVAVTMDSIKRLNDWLTPDTRLVKDLLVLFFIALNILIAIYVGLVPVILFWVLVALALLVAVIDELMYGYHMLLTQREQG